jgi:hypothetical protein
MFHAKFLVFGNVDIVPDSEPFLPNGSPTVVRYRWVAALLNDGETHSVDAVPSAVG